MTPGQRPEAIDTGFVFRTYAWIAVTGGLVVYVWPMLLLSNGQVFDRLSTYPWVLTRVAAALVVGSGCCAAGFARLGEPVGRRRALYAFALSHLLFGGLFFVQWQAIFEGILPPLVGWAPLLLGGVLLYVAVTGPSTAPIRRVFALAERDGPLGAAKVMRVDVKSEAMEALRSEYEARIEQVARQEERTRLARDLHDAVKQQLFVIQTAAATVDARFATDPPGAKAALEQVRTAAREAMTEMEAMIEQLQATPMENAGLIDALKRQCEALEFRTGAKVTLDVGKLPANGALPPGAQQGLFRGAQEALANVGRHARATQVVVSLGLSGHQLELTICDDGAGFDPVAVRNGMGLQNMTARAAALSGSFMVKSAPGAGTLVRFSVPCAHLSPRGYGVKAMLWATVLVVGIWFVQFRGPNDQPWAFGVLAIATIATGRYLVAYFKADRWPETTA